MQKCRHTDKGQNVFLLLQGDAESCTALREVLVVAILRGGRQRMHLWNMSLWKGRCCTTRCLAQVPGATSAETAQASGWGKRTKLVSLRFSRWVFLSSSVKAGSPGPFPLEGAVPGRRGALSCGDCCVAAEPPLGLGPRRGLAAGLRTAPWC